jgi:hypothetical protein
VVTDRANGALVSCSATVRSVPSAVLELSTSQSPVASGGNFSYTLAYHNGTASALSSAQLSFRWRLARVIALFVSAGAQKPLFCSFQSGYLSLLPEMIV